MVTAACSSGSSGTNMTTSENDKEANISFVYLGVSKKMYGELLYSLCQASYNDDTKELCLEITGNEKASLTYSLSEIEEEYIDKAKKNKVSVIYKGNKFYPVVLKKDSDNTPQNLWGFGRELRKFQYTCILKDFNLTGELGYDLLYHGAFLNGCTKVGNQMIKQGRYFFAENDFMPEITSVDVFGQKGTFSAGLSIFDNPSSNDFFAEDRFGTYRYALVQVLYEMMS